MDIRDAILDSAEAGVEKPDPRLFQMGASLAGLLPSQCTYIGDILAVDVRGARAAGMDAILLDPAGLYGRIEGQTVRSCRQLLDRFQ